MKIGEKPRKTAKNRRINAKKRKWMKIGEKPRKTAESMQNGQKLKKKHEKTPGSEVNGGGSEVGSEVNGGGSEVDRRLDRRIGGWIGGERRLNGG